VSTAKVLSPRLKFDDQIKKNVRIEHILREHYTRADMISRLATIKKKGLYHSIIYIILKNPVLAVTNA